MSEPGERAQLIAVDRHEISIWPAARIPASIGTTLLQQISRFTAPFVFLRRLRAIKLVLLASALWLGGCVSQKLPPRVLNGSLEAAIGPPAAAAMATDPFRLSDEDRRWLGERIDSSSPQLFRFRALLKLFQDSGELALEYDLTTSTSASDTLAARRGNCLSFTVLFVALAREIGIEAHVQAVSIPPAWSRLQNVVVANQHVVAWGRFAGRSWEVDFGRFARAADTPRRLFSDRQIRAVLASNQGASLLAIEDNGLPLLRAALRVDEELVQGWVNLGVGLARNNDPSAAEYAFRRALEHSPGDGSALSGLLRLYQHIDPATAAKLDVLMPALAARNPWVLYARGQQSLAEGDVPNALTVFEAAERSAPQEPWFHIAIVRAHALAGDQRGARRALRRAQRRLGDEAQYALLLAELLQPERQALTVAAVGPDKLGAPPEGKGSAVP